MRVTLALAALPLAVFALAPRVPFRASAPRAPAPVVSEGVHIIPLDARGFNARWWPDQAPTAVRVKTVPVRVLTNEKPGEPVGRTGGNDCGAAPAGPRHEARGATKSLGHLRPAWHAESGCGARQVEGLAMPPRLATAHNEEWRCPKCNQHYCMGSNMAVRYAHRSARVPSGGFNPHGRLTRGAGHSALRETYQTPGTVT